MNLKAERYKYLLDNRDKQIEKLEKEIEKFTKEENIKENKDKDNKNIIKNRINNTYKINDKLLTEENKNEKNENDNNIDINTDKNKEYKKISYKKMNNCKKKINNDTKINIVYKDNYNSSKINKDKSNDNINNSQNIMKEEELTTIKTEKGKYVNIKINNKSLKNKLRKEKTANTKKLKGSYNNNLHSFPQSNIYTKNQINNTNLNDRDNILNSNNINSILNLGSSVKISINNNLMNFSDKLKDNNITNSINNINIGKNKKKARSPNNKDNYTKKENSMKNLNKENNNIDNNSNNIKFLLDKIYLIIKKEKKNQNEFISFVKKINKELNMNIINNSNNINNSNKKIGNIDNNKISNNNLNNYNTNEELINEKNKEIKELKNQLNISKRREADIKLKLTFLQSEKIKLEEEKIKLNEELKKLSQRNSIFFSDVDYYPKKSKKLHSEKNVLIENDIGRFTTNLNNSSSKKERESFEGLKFISDKNVISAEKSSKYTFRKKKLLNKSPSLEPGKALNFKKLFSDEKKSIYEDDSNDVNIENNNNENNTIVSSYKNKVKELENDNINLSEKIKNLNNELENVKLKENNLELINTDLMKENIKLKQCLIILKENYEKEYSLVSESLINLTEKYQQIKKELKQKREQE